MIRWYAGGDVTEPEAVECPVRGYPNQDSKGRDQFDNSHFDLIEDAWEHLRRDADAHVSLVGLEVQNAEGHLLRANEQAGRAAVRFRAVKEAYRRWERSSKGAAS